MSTGRAVDRRALAAVLAGAGCVAASEEADELAAAAAGPAELSRLLARRVAGEPLAWVTGTTSFAGQRLRVRPGVYVPRRQTEALVRRALARLPAAGVAADLCTGSGAVAAVLARGRPGARVVATDLDPLACRCAATNGVDVRRGHLADPLPDDIRGRCDVVTAVPPYVPSDQVRYLPSDARDHEPRRALDGGPDGLGVLLEVVAAARGLLRPGGALLVEVGGDQDEELAEPLVAAGFAARHRIEDDDGDLRGVEATLGEPELAGGRRSGAAAQQGERRA